MKTNCKVTQKGSQFLAIRIGENATITVDKNTDIAVDENAEILAHSDAFK